MANASNSSNLPFDIIFIKEYPDDIIECFIKDKFNRFSPTRTLYKKDDPDTFIELFDGTKIYFSISFLSLLLGV